MPQSFGSLEPQSLGIEIVADRVEACPSPARYHTEFSQFRLNGTGIGRGSRKILGRWAPPLWDGAVADHIEIHHFPHVLPYQTW